VVYEFNNDLGMMHVWNDSWARFMSFGMAWA